MTRGLLAALVVLLGCAPVAAQPAPTVVTTLRSTSTAAGSVKVGCGLTGPCTGGLTAGAIDVASVTSAGFVEIANNVPGSCVNRLVNTAGTLSFNCVTLAAGGSISGTLNAIPVFTSANSLGNSIMAQNVGATIITVTGALNATTTLGGTLSTAAQNSVTTMTALASVGTITTGVWNGTIIDLARGGTGADLSGTGGTSQFLRQNTVGGTVTVVRPAVSDLSDGSNIALLNAANVFTATQNVRAVVPTADRVYSLGTTSLQWDRVWASVLSTSDSGGIDILPTHAAGALRFHSANTLRWGINAAGDWTFGASSHIADSSGVPVSLSCVNCTVSAIAGNDYAFRATFTGVSSPQSGSFTFGRTFAAAPVCVANGFAAYVLVTATTTTTMNWSVPVGSSNVTIAFLCRGF